MRNTSGRRVTPCALFLLGWGMTGNLLLQAGPVALTLGFESDPRGAPPFGAAVAPAGSTFLTNAPVFAGAQSLALVATGAYAQAAWNYDSYPDVFGVWNKQPFHIPMRLRVAARAAQTNATLDLWLGRDNNHTLTAVRLQFAANGTLAAVCADGSKTLAPYAADTWYRFDVSFRTGDPRYAVAVGDAKGKPLATATNLLWFQPQLTNDVLFGFALSVQGPGKFFIDELRVEEAEPTEMRAWPRKLVKYPGD
jgi:hypothetical protein